jgi:hypothetical protein
MISIEEKNISCDRHFDFNKQDIQYFLEKYT